MMPPYFGVPREAIPVEKQLGLVAWECHSCDVRGRGLASGVIMCWCCGSNQITVTARPFINSDEWS